LTPLTKILRTFLAAAMHRTRHSGLVYCMHYRLALYTRTIRYDTRCCFNVRSKLPQVDLIYRTEPTTKKWKEKNLKVKKDILRNIGKQSGESA